MAPQATDSAAETPQFKLVADEDTKNKKNKSDSSSPLPPQTPQQCIECLRRKQACDGLRPVCRKCCAASIVCPGYGEQKPLTWLAPGKVTLRTRRPRAPKKVVDNVVDDNHEKRDAVGCVTTTATSKHPAKTTDRGVKTRGAMAVRLSNGPKSKSASSTVQTQTAFIEDGASLEVNDVSLVRNKHQAQTNAVNEQQQQWHQQSIPVVQIRPHLWDALEAVDFYNAYIHTARVSNNIAPSPFFPHEPLPSDVLFTVSPTSQHSFVSAMLALRISYVARTQGVGNDHRNPGPAAALWSSYHYHTGMAVSALNDKMNRDSYNDDETFLCINDLISSELLLSTTLHWRAHANGFFALIRLRGGLHNLMDSPEPLRCILLGFIVHCTIMNTTSPSNNQIRAVSQFSIDDVLRLYKEMLYPPVMCPPYLFLDIIRINNLRERSAKMPNAITTTTTTTTAEPSTNDGFVIQTEIDALLTHIEAFSTDHWTQSSGLPNTPACQLIGRIYHSAVALYALLSLPCVDDCDTAKTDHRTRLSRLLAKAMSSPACMKTIRWPLVIAGVAAADGTDSDRAQIQQYLTEANMSPDVGMGPMVARAVLKNFWKSGKRGWDECFDRPYMAL